MSCAGAQCSPPHHWSAGTAALTSSMCSPQPSQVVLPQTEHGAGRHMVFSLLLFVLGAEQLPSDAPDGIGSVGGAPLRVDAGRRVAESVHVGHTVLPLREPSGGRRVEKARCLAVLVAHHVL